MKDFQKTSYRNSYPKYSLLSSSNNLTIFDGEILEIFSWLPAKSLLRLSTVCKASYRFVSNPFFVKKQNTNMQMKTDSCFFIEPNSCKRYKDKLEFHVFPGEENSSGAPSECVEFLKNTGRVLASSSGVICCRNTTNRAIDQLFIYNLATQSWVGIPSPTSLRDTYDRDLCIFFHCNIDLFDQFPNDYLLMIMEGKKDWSNSRLCKIYVPRKGIWLETGHDVGGRNLLFESAVYSSATVYFLSDWSLYFTKNSPFYWPYIVAFDLKEGKSRFCKIPKGARRGLNDRSCKISIFSWKREKLICLVKLLKGVFIVWELKDSNLGLWSKILKICARAIRMVEPDPSIFGFTIMNGNSLLIATEKRVYKYDLTGDWKSKKIEKTCRHQCGENVLVTSYLSTLRPCRED